MTSKEPAHRDWIKLWVKESLLGTIREDLTPEERATWYDFLLLAGNSRIAGTICANENSPMPVKRIAGILNIKESLVKHCIDKFILSSRISIDEYGVIHIINWAKYQYSDYDRQKIYRTRKKTNARWEAMSEEDKQTARTAFGDPETWDEMTWIAVTKRLATSQMDDIEREIAREAKEKGIPAWKFPAHKRE